MRTTETQQGPTKIMIEENIRHDKYRYICTEDQIISYSWMIVVYFEIQ